MVKKRERSYNRRIIISIKIYFRVTTICTRSLELLAIIDYSVLGITVSGTRRETFLLHRHHSTRSAVGTAKQKGLQLHGVPALWGSRDFRGV